MDNAHPRNIHARAACVEIGMDRQVPSPDEDDGIGMQRPGFPHDASPVRPRSANAKPDCMALPRTARPQPGGESARNRDASRRTARSRTPSVPPGGLCRLQHPAPGGPTATLRSWAGHDRPVLGDPSRDSVAHIVDAPLSRLPVRQAGGLEASLPAMTDQGDGPVGAGNGARLAPFLRRPHVDDRRAGRRRALESGAVDMDDFGAKRRPENERQGDEGNRSQHGSILARLVPFGWIFGSRRRRAAGAARSPAFTPLSRKVREGVGWRRTCGGGAEHGECGEDVANAAVVHGLAPSGSQVPV